MRVLTVAGKTRGEAAYNAYGDLRKWTTANGGPMPRWSDQKPDLQEAWEIAGRAAVMHHLDQTKGINAYQLCDEDTVAAASLEEAITWYCREQGIDRDDIDEAAPEVPMTGLFYEDEARTGRITVARAIAECLDFPTVLFSTEY